MKEFIVVKQKIFLPDLIIIIKQSVLTAIKLIVFV